MLAFCFLVCGFFSTELLTGALKKEGVLGVSVAATL